MTTLTRRTLPQGRDKGSTAKDILGLCALLLGVSLLALLHWRLAGAPELPSDLPDVDRIRRILTSSDVASGDAISFAGTIGWLALIYLAGSTGIRILFGIVWRLTDGASWCSAALHFSDLTTLPVVRRIVDGAIIGVIVLSLWVRERPSTEASPASNVAALVSYLPGQQSMAEHEATHINQLEPLAPAAKVSYSVVEGESLWSIARRLYGDGTQYRMIFRENNGTQIPSGAALVEPRTIEGGSSLNVPLPTPNLWSSEGQVVYRVQAGDSLWSIAASFLGDGFRWMEVWKLNQGQTMSDGRPFHDPNLIFPGWVLQIPGGITQDPPAEPAQPEAAPTETPPVASVNELPEPGPTANTGDDVQPEVPATNSENDGGDRMPAIPWPGVLPVLLSAAGIAGASMTFLLVRALATRAIASGNRIKKPSEKPIRPRGDAGRVVLASRALLSALSEVGFADSRLVFIREAARYQDFFIECPPGDADALVRGRHDLGRRLACGVEAEVESQTQVRLRLSRFQRLAGLLIEEGGEVGALPLLVPVGGDDGGVCYLNLAAAGTALVAGTSEQTSQLLSGWLQTLAATFRPDELSVLLERTVEQQLPVQAALEIVESTEDRSAGDLFDEIADMIVAREKASSTAPQTMVLALASMDGSDSLDSLETVYRHGRENNIALVVVVGNRSDIDPAAVTGTRVAFSNSVLAEQLGEPQVDGDLVLSVGRRAPVTLRAIEVRTEVVPLAPEEVNEGVFEEEDLDPFVPEQDREQSWPGGGAEAEPFDTVDQQPPPDVDEADGDSFAGEDGLGLGTEGQIPLTFVSGGEATQEDGESSWGADPLFSVRCFGAFDVTFEGRRVDWRISKSRELLAFLLAQREATVQRETVMEALWPDALSSQVEHMLSNASYYLRNSLRVAANGRKDIQVIFAPRQRCRLQSSLFRSDADAFDAHLRRAASLQGRDALIEYERGLNLYRGDLFGKEPFEWATAYRIEFQRRFLGAAHQAAKLALECRDAARALGFYRAILDHDPIDEEAARGLMQVYANQGDTNGVKKVYKVLCESLRQELGDTEARPLPDTEAIFHELTRRSV